MMYDQYPLSLRQVEDLLYERGIDVSYETVRVWWNRFRPEFASEIRKKKSESVWNSPQWRWHADKVFVRINGETYYLWRAVDHDGEDLEAVVTKRRNRSAALRFLKKSMKRYDSPEVIATDKFRSYRTAMKEIGNADHREASQWLNNLAENAYQPFWRRERAMTKFRSIKSLQKFASIHSSIHNHFNREAALAEWRQFAAWKSTPHLLFNTLRFSSANAIWDVDC